MLVLGIITGLIVLVLLVVVHELGHAIVARRNGVVVEEFGIGFPPKAWAKKLKDGVLFTVNWLPLGGFVRLKGEYDSAKGKGTYGASSFWVKTKILLAGVVMNFLVAAVLFTILALVGLPKIIPNQFVLPVDNTVDVTPLKVAAVVEGSAADQAGFLSNDQITGVDSTKVQTGDDFIAYTRAHAGEEVAVQFIRNGDPQTARVTLGTNTSAGIFGASLGQSETIHATWSAPVVGVATAAQLGWETLKGVGGIIGNLASGFVGQFSGNETTREQAHKNLESVGNSVAGPVGILAVIFPSAEAQGFSQIVLLTAIISLSLAVMNILPIPGLDGGRWFTMAIFRLIRKPLTKEREEIIQGTGFLILLALIVLITIADIGKLW
jgi:regulator of sigma E protease